MLAELQRRRSEIRNMQKEIREEARLKRLAEIKLRNLNSSDLVPIGVRLTRCKRQVFIDATFVNGTTINKLIFDYVDDYLGKYCPQIQNELTNSNV